MTILYIFLALVWAICSLGTFVGGVYLVYRYAIDADRAGTGVYKALLGMAVRLLLTLAAVALIVGLPLQLMGV